MAVTSRWMFVFIGNNTGKTTIQRTLVELLSGRAYLHLTSNQVHNFSHSHLPRRYERFFVAGRSYQELRARQEDAAHIRYTTVKEYFERRIDIAIPFELAFIASHLNQTDIEEIICEAHARLSNVCGVFLSNSVIAAPAPNATIADLRWDERWMLENPPVNELEAQNRQLRLAAETIIQMLIERTRGW
jgi:hypothetical protein